MSQGWKYCCLHNIGKKQILVINSTRYFSDSVISIAFKNIFLIVLHISLSIQKKKNQSPGEQPRWQRRKAWVHLLPQAHQNYNYLQNNYLWEPADDYQRRFSTTKDKNKPQPGG